MVLQRKHQQDSSRVVYWLLEEKYRAANLPSMHAVEEHVLGVVHVLVYCAAPPVGPDADPLVLTVRISDQTLTPLQVESADGCHLDRQTLSTVRAAGFVSVDAEVIDLRGFWVLSPTAAGIALR